MPDLTDEKLERCSICDDTTGRAGKDDDSLYGDDDSGPYCQECFDLLAEGPRALVREVRRLREELSVDRAVCLCGCPADRHEACEEGGESCGCDDHDCLRVAPAVAKLFADLRSELEAAERDRDRAMRFVELLAGDGALADDVPGEVEELLSHPAEWARDYAHAYRQLSHINETEEAKEAAEARCRELEREQNVLRARVETLKDDAYHSSDRWDEREATVEATARADERRKVAREIAKVTFRWDRLTWCERFMRANPPEGEREAQEDAREE